jgi:hypothetical protein
MLTTRESFWMGDSAALTASLYCVSLTESVSLLKIRSKVAVVGAVLPLPSSLLMSRLTWADSRLLDRGPPLVSVPPRTRNTTDAASTAPEPTSVAQRCL